jgi:hypothetical protein
MKNIKKRISFLFFICIHYLYAQQTIHADLKVGNDGSITIAEKLNDFLATDTLLLHRNIPLFKNNNEILKDKTRLFRNHYLQYFRSDGKLNYTVKVPKTHYDNFFLKESVFFISENYLALNKSNFNAKKKIDLKISLPQGLNLIYPTQDDLAKEFYIAPAIIAGNFKHESKNGYQLYTRENIPANQERLKEIIEVADKALSHFQIVFSKRIDKPEIIFLPFESNLAGKNIDNLLILNENFLKGDGYNKKVLIHEILHFWWGDNSIRFENPVITEAVTEFFTLRYLNTTGDLNYLERQLTEKRKNIKTIKNYNLNFDAIKDQQTYKTYCYDLLPLLFWFKSGTDKILTDFYKMNQNSFVSDAECAKLLKQIGIDSNGANSAE